MAQDIDFLPDSYRHRRQCRRKKVWRRGVLLVFLALISMGALRQRYVRGQLEANRDALRQEAARMFGQLDDTTLLRRKIDDLDAKANLITHLRLRTPPTRLLAAVTNNLPHSVTLSDFHAASDRLEPASPRRVEPPPAKQTDTGKPLESTETRDLEQLRQTAGQRALFVALNGTAADDVAISRYLAALERCGIFDDVQLLFTDHRTHGDRPLRSFAIRLRVRTPKPVLERIDPKPPRAANMERTVR